MALFKDESFARRAFARGAPAHVLVNPIEYHGPHLSLENDQHIARGISRDLHAALFPQHPWLVSEDLNAGVDPVVGPGTVVVPFQGVCASVLAAAEELIELGASRVFWMTFHGSPLHLAALDVGRRRLLRAGIASFSPMHVVLNELLFAVGEAYADAFESVPSARRDELMRGLPSDFHGGFFETSLALHYAPGSVSSDLAHVPDCPPVTLPKFVPAPVWNALGRVVRSVATPHRAAELSVAFRGALWGSLRPFPGYTSAPSFATAAAGSAFARHLLARIVPAARGVLEREIEHPSRPLKFLQYATFGGRVDLNHARATPVDLRR